MAARRKAEDREPDSVGPATDRNRALAALADKGVVKDEESKPVTRPLPALSGMEHDLGGDVRAVSTYPSYVVYQGDRTRIIYRGDVVLADQEWVEARDGFVKL